MVGMSRSRAGRTTYARTSRMTVAVWAGSTMTLFTDDARVGEGHVDATIPFTFSLDETLDVGLETGSPVPGTTAQ